MSHRQKQLVSFLRNICPDVLLNIYNKLAREDNRISCIPNYRESSLRCQLEDMTCDPMEGLIQEMWDLELLLFLLPHYFHSKLNSLSTVCLQEIRDVAYLIETAAITDTVFELLWTRLKFSTLYLAEQYLGKDVKQTLQDKIEKSKAAHYTEDKSKRIEWLKEAKQQLLRNVDDLNSEIENEEYGQKIKLYNDDQDFERSRKDIDQELIKSGVNISESKQHQGSPDTSQQLIKEDQDFERSRKDIDQELIKSGVNISESKQHQDSPKTLQQLAKEVLASKWETVTTVEDAAFFTKAKQLPDKQTLCNLVKRLGRGSTTVSFLCESICTRIKETTTDVTHVFAAYTEENQNSVHFVEYFDNVSNVSASNIDYDMVCINNRGVESRSEQIEELNELSTEESLALKKAINTVSKQYMEKYKYLSAITARNIKSEEEENLCIVMYVHPCTERYSSIPITEEPLPKEIAGYKVIVRSGVFKAATNTACEYHANLRMGCKITSNLVNTYGTLGSFIDHPEYGLCGFTCAHAVYGVEQMQELKKAKKLRRSVSKDPCLVYQPSTDVDPIGRVVEAVFTEGEGDSSGVDLALFQIENRPPRTGTFPSKDENLKYVTGKTLGRTMLTCMPCEVQKFGATTGSTTGKVLFDGMCIKYLTFVSKDALEKYDSLLFNQYNIISDTCNFCEQGDSGGLVLMKDCTDELVCIGMVIGGIEGDQYISGVATPITDILRELKVQKLKTFREELTVDHFEKRLAETQNQLRNEMASMHDQTLSEIKKILANFQREIPNILGLQQRQTENMTENQEIPTN